jgi:hypothetical protein
MNAQRKQYLESAAEQLVRENFLSTCKRNDRGEAIAWLSKVRAEASKMLNAQVDAI